MNEYKLRIESEGNTGIFSEIHGIVEANGNDITFISNEGDYKIILQTIKNKSNGND